MFYDIFISPFLLIFLTFVWIICWSKKRFNVFGAKKLDMKIFSANQIKDIDAYTVAHEPILSIDLMERAAEVLFSAIIDIYPHAHRFVVFCGPGNNGGDGLAVARLLAHQGKSISVYLLCDPQQLSPDALINYKRLIKVDGITSDIIRSEEDLPLIGADDIVVDALFGSGLSRPLVDLPYKIVCHINDSHSDVVSIDIPSGLPGEESFGYSSKGIVRATRTLTLQFPKLSFFFPENEEFVGQFHILPIGLHPIALSTLPTPYRFTTESDASSLLPSRSLFGHKGTFGHLLLVAGSKGMMGASVLAARGAYRAGAGLVTAHIPAGQGHVVHISIPEVIVSEDIDSSCFSALGSLAAFSAVAVGPGITTHPKAKAALRQLLKEVSVPLLLDADAINIIAEERDMIALLPPNAILTPHPKELSRLIGTWSSSYNRLEMQRAFAQKYGVVLLCKGAFTSIALPSGELYFNSTGNSGMATGGSGDVLSGIIGGLLAQGIKSSDAAILGVYLHGLAGDIAALEMGQQAIMASDLTNSLAKAWLTLSRLPLSK